MEIVRCSKGHFYDSEENATCPMCAAEAARNKNPIGNNVLPDGIIGTSYFDDGNTPSPTLPVDPNGGRVQPYQTTVNAGLQDTQSNDNGGMGAFPKTMPLTPPTFLSEEDATTFDPVVGWLVCIEGATKGTDYRIHSQNNYIGRSAKMDISIPEDSHISAENSAIIAYDNEDRVFYFGPCSGRNIVRVNGKPALSVEKIEAYDVLTIGTTKLLFVPLCGDRFDWNEKK